MGLGGSLGEAGVVSGSLWEQGHWWWRLQGIFISIALLKVVILAPRPGPTQQPAGPVLWYLRPSNRVRTQFHPLADRLPKVTLSPQSHLNTILDKALPTRGTRPSSTHQWSGTSPSHQEACTSLRTNLTHQREDTRSKRNYSPAACKTEMTSTKSKTKQDGSEICSRRRSKIKPQKNN